MTDRPVTKDELDTHLHDQLDFLESAAIEFDSRGKTNRAKQMAGIIRTLVHQTKHSRSLIKQVGLESRFYMSSSPAIDGKNLLPECGLLGIEFTNSGVKYVSLLDDCKMQFVSLDEWWNDSVIDDKDGNIFSRKDLVLEMANRDGGAHVDPNISISYARFRDSGLRFEVNHGKKMGVHPERYAVRQIAHELLKSLKPEYKKMRDKTDCLALISGIRLQMDKPADDLSLDYWDIYKDDDNCPCRSGISFSSCHKLGANRTDEELKA